MYIIIYNSSRDISISVSTLYLRLLTKAKYIILSFCIKLPDKLLLSNYSSYLLSFLLKTMNILLPPISYYFHHITLMITYSLLKSLAMRLSYSKIIIYFPRYDRFKSGIHIEIPYSLLIISIYLSNDLYIDILIE
jgi:hypothetical protein